MIDANILLDVLAKREKFYKDSSLIWLMCETGKATGYVSALTVANIIYIMRKELDEEKIKDVLDKLFLVFKVADLTGDILSSSATLKWKDYEDAVQLVTARKVHADCIVTRNSKDYKDSKIPVLTPAEFVRNI